MKFVYLILFLILTFFIVTFSLDNSVSVEIKYYTFFKFQVPLYILLFISLMFGVIITGFLGVIERFRLNRTISRLNKTIRDQRKEMRANEAPPILEDNKPPTQY